jgi:hypothetical protein
LRKRAAHTRRSEWKEEKEVGEVEEVEEMPEEREKRRDQKKRVCVVPTRTLSPRERGAKPKPKILGVRGSFWLGSWGFGLWSLWLWSLVSGPVSSSGPSSRLWVFIADLVPSFSSLLCLV